MPLAAEDTLKIAGLVSMGAILWLFCAFTIAARARGVGQSYRLWLFVGLVTGPVGLVAGYLYFKVAGERYRRSRYGEGGKYDIPEMIRCQGCGQSIPRSFEECQFCGRPLHAGKRR